VPWFCCAMDVMLGEGQGHGSHGGVCRGVVEVRKVGGEVRQVVVEVVRCL
jgi:hypothetical protein